MMVWCANCGGPNTVATKLVNKFKCIYCGAVNLRDDETDEWYVESRP